MLVNLHVKDLALIKEADIDFKEGLNVLTGETGAGKSIIIGSITLALGEKSSKEVIRAGEDSALVELVFSVRDEIIIEKIKEMDIPIEEDGQIIISRKIMDGHSVNKINGITVTLGVLREITSQLVDVHGQHDHQSLLNRKRHLEFLDKFAGNSIDVLKYRYSNGFNEYNALKKQVSTFDMDEEQRLRELSLLEFEINEIESAAFKENEDSSLEELFKKISSSKKIVEVLGVIHETLENINLGKSIKDMAYILEYDKELESIYEGLSDMESISGDLSREIFTYIENNTFDLEKLNEVETRLDLINKLKSKYGNTFSKIMEYKEGVSEKLEKLNNYQDAKKSLENEILEKEKQLFSIAGELSDLRKKASLKFQECIVAELTDLNFLDARFELEFTNTGMLNSQGIDDVEFLISTNPGEPIKQLSKVASGGELSRIMLAFKTILAKQDNIGTLIFDEIDAGISGKTAGKVAERLSIISRNHQVICISHLAQIAAMSEHHYLIEKNIVEDSTVTQVRNLNEDDSINEIARILGGTHITEAVKNNAKEMKKFANEFKTKD